MSTSVVPTPPSTPKPHAVKTIVAAGGIKLSALYFLATLLLLSCALNIFLITKIRWPLLQTGTGSIKQVIPSLTAADHVRGGDANLPLIIEYSDFQCPYCLKAHKGLKELVATHKIRWVYRHYPLTGLHPFAMDAAVAAECAASQGKFWEYADEIFDHQKELNSSLFRAVAINKGLNLRTFDECRAPGGTGSSAVRAQMTATEGIEATPTLFANEHKITGWLPEDVLLKIITSDTKLYIRKEKQ